MKLSRLLWWMVYNLTPINSGQERPRVSQKCRDLYTYKKILKLQLVRHKTKWLVTLGFFQGY